jgi:glycosyltransferase involved in cell wall biosynthesis
MEASRPSRGRVCVVRQYQVPLDARVYREVLSLADAGFEVDVICQQGDGERLVEDDQGPTGERGRIRYYRIPVRRRRTSTAVQFVEYLLFFLATAVLLTGLHLRRRYRLVQVNTVPDVLVFAALVPKLLGAKVVIDLHETMPEFFASKFGVPLSHRGPRVAAALEKASVAFADAAVTVTDPMKEAFIGRGLPAGKLTVVLNGPDERIYDADRFPARLPDGEFHLISHGSLEERYGIDTMIRAMALLAGELPELRLKIYGRGSQLGELQKLAADLGVAHVVWFSGGFVPLDEIVQAVAEADAGVVAMKKDVFRDLTLATKMYEYIAMGKPVIVGRTRSVEVYFDEKAFALFRSDDPADLARAIREVVGDPDRRREMVEQAAEQGRQHRWPPNRERYLALVNSLLAD